MKILKANRIRGSLGWLCALSFLMYVATVPAREVPAAALAQAMAREDLAAIRTAVAAGRAALGFYSIPQTSTDLINWTSIAALVNSNGMVQFTDIGATNQTRRFYRAVVP